jgi:hypothetical protein
MSFGFGFGFPKVVKTVGGATLNFNFLSGSLDSRITFTRASTATFFNSSGVLTSASNDVARFDYNPATLAPLGLLIEESRTNLLTYSADFGDAAWSKSETNVSTNSTLAPDGTTSADTLTPSTNNAGHTFSRLGIITGAGTFTDSLFIKPNGYNFVVSSADTGGFVIFDLSNGTINSTSGGATGTITAVGNGWYRCVATRTTTGAATIQYQIRIAAGTFSYAGDGTSGLFVWGAQLEAGAFPTSYIPTTTTALTRAADVASVGTLTPWYNAVEGTIYAEYSLSAISTTAAQTAVFISDNTSNNRNNIRTSGPSSNNAGVVVSGGVLQSALTSAIAVVNVTQKIASAYKVNDFAYSDKGGAVLTDTTGTIPTVTQMQLGNGLSAEFLNGYLRRVVFYPRRLANAELQSITL